MISKIISLISFTILLPITVFASGGGSTPSITESDFIPIPTENGYTVTGQGVTVSIVNGVATVTKGNDIVVVGDTVDVSGDIETRRLAVPPNAVGDTGLATTGGVQALTVTTPGTTTVTNPSVQTKSINFSDSFFKKFGIGN